MRFQMEAKSRIQILHTSPVRIALNYIVIKLIIISWEENAPSLGVWLLIDSCKQWGLIVPYVLLVIALQKGMTASKASFLWRMLLLGFHPRNLLPEEWFVERKTLQGWEFNLVSRALLFINPSSLSGPLIWGYGNKKKANEKLSRPPRFARVLSIRLLGSTVWHCPKILVLLLGEAASQV